MPDFKIPDMRVIEAATIAGYVMLVLLAFYLYLLARPQCVKRPLCLLFGVAGLLFAIAGQFFALGSPTITVWAIFTTIGNLAALLGAVAACFGGKLPGVDDSKLGSQTIEPPKPQ